MIRPCGCCGRAQGVPPGGLRREEGGGEERRAELAAPDELAGIGRDGALERREVRRGCEARGWWRGAAAEAEEAGDTGGAAGERAERRHGCLLTWPGRKLMRWSYWWEAGGRALGFGG